MTAIQRSWQCRNGLRGVNRGVVAEVPNEWRRPEERKCDYRAAIIHFPMKRVILDRDVARQQRDR